MSDDTTPTTTPAEPPILPYGTVERPSASKPAPWGAVAVVAVKLAGFYFLLQALSLLYLLPFLLSAMFMEVGPAPADWIFTLIVPASNLFIGLLLVVKADAVATKVLGFEDARDDFVLRAPGRRLQSIAFSVLGLWLAVSAASEIVAAIAHGVRDVRITGQDVTRGASIVSWQDVVAPLIKAVAGVWLFFGSKQLARSWQRFRDPTPAGAAGDATDHTVSS